jgi:riboflavin synthase
MRTDLWRRCPPKPGRARPWVNSNPATASIWNGPCALMDGFGGHFVLGHVDGVGRVASITDQGEFSLWRFDAPDEVAQYLVPKGSIAIDGISLTVVAPERNTFSVAIIPTTVKNTTLGAKRPNDPVNLEADVLGKHIHHYMNRQGSGGITTDFLAQHGFV